LYFIIFNLFSLSSHLFLLHFHSCRCRTSPSLPHSSPSHSASLSRSPCLKSGLNGFLQKSCCSMFQWQRLGFCCPFGDFVVRLGFCCLVWVFVARFPSTIRFCFFSFSSISTVYWVDWVFSVVRFCCCRWVSQMGLNVGFCCSFGFLLSNLVFCCSFSVAIRFCFFSFSSISTVDWVFSVVRFCCCRWVSQMGLNVGFCCSLQCSSPGSFVIAGGEDREVREREEERRERQRCQERERVFFN
jgi:hypothetical protein